MSVELSRKLYLVQPGLYMHWCPGCKSRHQINTDAPNHNGAKWSYNGNPERPSFVPSVHISIGPWSDGEVDHPKTTTCHYFITDGSIMYCPDSAHEFAGQTLELPDFPPGR